MSQVIKIKNSFLTKNFLTINTITEVEISDTVFGIGGFACLYNCISINSRKPSIPMLIKVFVEETRLTKIAYNAVIKLQRKMNELFQNNTVCSYKKITEVPALKAFPIFSFDGVLNGKQIQGYSATNLTEFGFSSLDTITETEIEKDKFRKLSFKERLKYCFHLAKGFEILSNINYVHADITPQNLFINFDTSELAIIDYDGGCIINTAQDKPLAIGKPRDGEWMAPEIYEQEQTNSEVNVDQYSDRWSVSVAFHYLLFGYDPFFFVREQSKKCKEVYLNANTLYPINLTDPNVSENAVLSVDSYYNTIKTNIPAAIHQAMITNYTEGFFNPHQRTPYSVWMELFKQTQSPPVFEYFNINKDFALKGTQINLSWKVNDAIELIIDNQIGDVTGKSEITTRPEQSMTYWLNARGHFGEAKQPAEVSIFPVPLLEYLKVPTPNFESSVTPPEIVIDFPVINLSIELDKSKLTQTPTVFISLSNDFANMQPGYKKGSALGSISYIFNKIKQAIISN